MLETDTLSEMHLSTSSISSSISSVEDLEDLPLVKVELDSKLEEEEQKKEEMRKQISQNLQNKLQIDEIDIPKSPSPKHPKEEPIFLEAQMKGEILQFSSPTQEEKENTRDKTESSDNYNISTQDDIINSDIKEV
jgi:hypothetical protein